MSSHSTGGLAGRIHDREGEITKFILAKDWSKTPLGAMKDWSQSLDFAVNLCLNSAFPVAIWWCDELVNIYNESFRDLFHLKHSESLGTTGALLWPDLWKDIGPSLQTVLKEGIPTVVNKHFTFTFENHSNVRSFSFYNSPVFDGPGNVGGVFTTVVETTKSTTGDEAGSRQPIMPDATGSGIFVEKLREKAVLLQNSEEMELKKQEERYVRMTEEVEDYAIILLGKDGTILNWNKGAQKIKGYSEEEIVGKNFSIFYLDDDKQNNLPGRLIQMAKEEGRAMHEGLRKRKDGSTFWGSIVITALHDENDNVIGFTKVTRDLTERKMAEDLVKQHAAELEIKNKQLEQFAYIASHDLQEPLRKIQTFVQVLEKKIDDAQIREKYFSKINSSAKRMADLIQSVLNYSRLAYPNELWVLASLNDIFENVLSDYELLIAEKNAVVVYDSLPNIPGIPLQLGQLFANLLGNSLKFSRVEPKITISWKVVKGSELRQVYPLADFTKEYIELIFSDNGIGFEQQYAEKIFTIFQRLNSREEFAGTGIGLALCKKIVENHNGYIYAKSDLDKGASFFIYLPYK